MASWVPSLGAGSPAGQSFPEEAVAESPFCRLFFRALKCVLFSYLPARSAHRPFSIFFNIFRFLSFLERDNFRSHFASQLRNVFSFLQKVCVCELMADAVEFIGSLEAFMVKCF